MQWRKIDSYIGNIVNELYQYGYTDICYDYDSDISENCDIHSDKGRDIRENLNRYNVSSIIISGKRLLNDNANIIKITISKIYDVYHYTFEKRFDTNDLKLKTFDPITDCIDISTHPIRITIQIVSTDSLILSDSNTLIGHSNSLSSDENLSTLCVNGKSYTIFPICKYSDQKYTSAIAANDINDMELDNNSFSYDNNDGHYLCWADTLSDEEREDIINSYGYDDPDMCLAVHKQLMDAENGLFDECEQHEKELNSIIDKYSKAKKIRESTNIAQWLYGISLSKTFYVDYNSKTDPSKFKYSIEDCINNDDIKNFAMISYDHIREYIIDAINAYDNINKIHDMIYQPDQKPDIIIDDYNLFCNYLKNAIDKIVFDKWWLYFNENWIRFYDSMIPRKNNEDDDSCSNTSHNQPFEIIDGMDDLPF